ncbi:hypothetical protein [Vibrio furnissii]|uniref:hypothetical protein n=1 Tax=Vibrio furnissii TaxID=29494 RepID=UPI0012AEA4D6|nr:hypothetical protein [Vibrio furnissii]
MKTSPRAGFFVTLRRRFDFTAPMTVAVNRSRQQMTVRRKAPNEFFNRFNLIPDHTEKGGAARFMSGIAGRA